MAHNPFVSVVIPALNEERMLAKTLKALSNLETSPDEYEVILVDNCSVDSTVEVARGFKGKFGLTIVSRADGTISALRNHGARLAKGDILAFLDADCLVKEDWLNRGTRGFKHPAIARDSVEEKVVMMVGAPYRIPDDSTWVARAWDLNVRRYASPREVKWLPSGNMFVTRRAFDEIGGFDGRLETNEDYDFCHRVRAGGYRILSASNIDVTHIGTPQTLRHLFRKELWHGRDVFRVFLASGRELKNLRAVALALFYVVCMLAVGMSVVFFLAGGSYLPVFGSFLLAVSVPCFLALKTCWVNKQYKYFFALILLYFVYGVARALCIVNLRWLRKNRAG